jgi:UDP-N-acetylglucosamine 3-dehydrogenase
MSAKLRGAVAGLGMMGRHHARILQSHPDIEFAGAVDPGGDRFGAVHDPAAVHADIDALLTAGPVDFAILSIPTDEHRATAERFAQAGAHMLIEKPLAGSVEEGRAIIDACTAAGVRAAVGHVERFNPALLEARRRMLGDQLGEIFLIATERVGPFPDRVRDVGVVKDLATHDLDIVRWLADAPVSQVAAQTAHKMGREHEDLVSVTGRLASGAVFSSLVDWVTPTKSRRTRVVGERGMLLADTLTADLTFFENAEVAQRWPSAQALRGVSEGNATRYALDRREPLLAEIEAFCALLRGDADAPVVSLEHGLETVAVAEAVLASAREGGSVKVAA